MTIKKAKRKLPLHDYSIVKATVPFGIKPVLKPGSGTWDHVQEIWEFSHDQVMEIQQYAEQNGAEDPPGNFLQKFGHCRVF